MRVSYTLTSLSLDIHGLSSSSFLIFQCASPALHQYPKAKVAPTDCSDSNQSPSDSNQSPSDSNQSPSDSNQSPSDCQEIKNGQLRYIRI